MDTASARVLTMAAEVGKDVLVVTARNIDVDDAHRVLAAVAPTDATVYRTQGDKGIAFPTGGRIRVRSITANNRGVSMDVLWLEPDAVPAVPTIDLLALLKPGGQMHRA